MHVVITFLPEDDSENKQIEGRTCRQDDPGSARKILFAEDLEKEFGIEKIVNAKAISGKDWDTFLLEQRSQHQVLLPRALCRLFRVKKVHAED